MKDTEDPESKKFPRHLPIRSRQLPKELLELQDYLKQLSAYVERYNRIKDNLARQNVSIPSVSASERKWGRERKGFPYRELGFSVREEIGESSAVHIIEMAPPEEVIVISRNEKRGKSEEEDETELSSVISNPAGKIGLDPASDESQIGIYFIEHVKPVNFVNVLQRELSTLGKIFPDVNDIIKQITHEFDHLKVCQKCLDKVSPLLPDILKELQELIKFVKKKRNEVYIWPDDSDYLRKTSEALSKPFGKQVEELERKKIRRETVGFVTVHTNTPQIIKECEANVRGEPRARVKSEHICKCSMRASDREQLTFLQSKIQTDLTQKEKAETAEAEIAAPKNRNGFGEKSVLTEFSTYQVLKTLHPVPVFQIVVQYKVQGSIEHLVKEMGPDEDQSDEFLALTDSDVDRARFQKSQALEVREFLLTAKTALRKACLELEIDSQSNSEIENELKTGVEDLKSLMLEVHKNQIELSKVVLEKEVLNPAIVELTNPLVLREEKEGVRKAQITMHEANLDNPRRDLQCLIDELKSKCEMKKRLIMSLLKELRSNVRCEEWEEHMRRVMQDSDSLLQLQTEERSDFFKESSLTFDEPGDVFTNQAWSPCIQRRSSFDEISSEREIAGTTFEQCIIPGRNSETISSQTISKKSESFYTVDEMAGRESPLKSKSFTMKELNVETETLFKDLENEINSLTFEHNRILCEIEGLKRKKSATNQEQGNKTTGSGSRAINVTIKIGDQDSVSGYHSALSIVPSGASLKEKKSELSFPVNTGEVSQSPGTRFSIREFKSALNLSKEELIKRHHSARKSTKSFTSLALKLKLPAFFKDEKTHRPSEGIFHCVTEEKLDNYLPVSLDSCTTCATVWTSKNSIPCCKNFPDSHFQKDFRGNRPSNEEFIISELSHLHPQINVHCEQNEAMKKLRSRLRFMEDDLHSLKMTIDRMDILTEKLVDDACESSANFKYVCNIFRFLKSQSNI